MTDVAQIPSEELIYQLTVRQCKRLLQHRRTDYRDIIEKHDLLRRVRELWFETKRNAEGRWRADSRGDPTGRGIVGVIPPDGG